MPHTVLVVDDEPNVVKMLKNNLEAEGYTVLCGYDGQMAIHLARTQRPNLIILDVNMPVTNGLKALQSIRTLVETKYIPVIILTGELSQTVYPVLEKTTRIAHIKKPIDLEHLNSMVRQFLQQYPTP